MTPSGDFINPQINIYVTAEKLQALGTQILDFQIQFAYEKSPQEERFYLVKTVAVFW